MGVKKQLRMGIYGGAFDPVHHAHLNLAETVTTYLQLDRLIWMPTGVAWHKVGSLSGAEHRVKMLELGFGQIEKSICQKWSIDTCEIERQGDSYTIDSVKLLQDDQAFLGAEWYLVIGADQFNVLHTWKNWPDLLERVTLAVFDRAGVDLDVQPDVLAKANWVHIPITPSPLSSSYIREQVRRLNTPLPQTGQIVVEKLTEFVPPLVAQYIVQHGLYVNKK